MYPSFLQEYPRFSKPRWFNILIATLLALNLSACTPGQRAGIWFVNQGLNHVTDKILLDKLKDAGGTVDTYEINDCKAGEENEENAEIPRIPRIANFIGNTLNKFCFSHSESITIEPTENGVKLNIELELSLANEYGDNDTDRSDTVLEKHIVVIGRIHDDFIEAFPEYELNQNAKLIRKPVLGNDADIYYVSYEYLVKNGKENVIREELREKK